MGATAGLPSSANLPATAHCWTSQQWHPRAFTLIEMLVSLAITLMMMAAVVTLFQNVTDSVTGSRSIIEMSERLRAARNRLQADLIGATASMTPPLRPENDEGYFEYVEGVNTDAINGVGGPAASLFGDTDDWLMFTVRSRGEPFVGKYNTNNTIESQVAEVVYFCVPNGPVVDATAATPVQLCTLYRRVLLVSAGAQSNLLSLFDPTVNPSPPSLVDFFNAFDLSTGRTGSFTGASPPNTPYYCPVLNTLGDLSKRELRFAHLGTTFPFTTSTTDRTTANTPHANTGLHALAGNRIGDDVLLTNVLAFDVQLYDPGAPIFRSGNIALEPRDPGDMDSAYDWVTASPTPYPAASAPGAFGGYADLGYGYQFRKPSNPSSSLVDYAPPATWTQPVFAGRPATKSQLTARPFVWDTWSLHYENDGIKQDTNNSAADLGTNGLDDAIPPATQGDGVVDDAVEFDTQPPFAAPLRGIRVIIRVYEPSSQQVREVTVVQDFLPE